MYFGPREVKGAYICQLQSAGATCCHRLQGAVWEYARLFHQCDPFTSCATTGRPISRPSQLPRSQYLSLFQNGRMYPCLNSLQDSKQNSSKQNLHSGSWSSTLRRLIFVSRLARDSTRTKTCRDVVIRSAAILCAIGICPSYVQETSVLPGRHWDIFGRNR